MTPVVMTPAEFATAMEACKSVDGDKEDMHIAADVLMCDLLVELGYGEGVAIFSEMDKWYA